MVRIITGEELVSISNSIHAQKNGAVHKPAPRREGGEIVYENDNVTATNFIDSDRFGLIGSHDGLPLFDKTVFKALSIALFGNTSDWWSGRDPAKIEAFLRGYYANPHLKLASIQKFTNQGNGFPVWHFSFAE